MDTDSTDVSQISVKIEDPCPTTETETLVQNLAPKPEPLTEDNPDQNSSSDLTEPLKTDPDVKIENSDEFNNDQKNSHTNSNTGIHYCSCALQFKTREELQAHQSSWHCPHSGRALGRKQKRFRCDICNQSYTRKRNLTRHHMIKHPFVPCPNPDKISSDVRQSKPNERKFDEKKMNESKKSQDCLSSVALGKFSATEARSKRQTTNADLLITDDELSEVPNAEIKSDGEISEVLDSDVNCDNKLSEASNMDCHKKLPLQNVAIDCDNKLSDVPLVENPTYPCVQCSEICKTAISLKRHYAVAHEEDKMLNQLKNGLPMKASWPLNKNATTSSSAPPKAASASRYTCDLCGLSWTKPSWLLKHMRTEHPEQYQDRKTCPHCKKVLSCFRSCARHMKERICRR